MFTDRRSAHAYTQRSPRKLLTAIHSYALAIRSITCHRCAGTSVGAKLVLLWDPLLDGARSTLVRVDLAQEDTDCDSSARSYFAVQ